MERYVCCGPDFASHLAYWPTNQHVSGHDTVAGNHSKLCPQNGCNSFIVIRARSVDVDAVDEFCDLALSNHTLSRLLNRPDGYLHSTSSSRPVCKPSYIPSFRFWAALYVASSADEYSLVPQHEPLLVVGIDKSC